MKLKLYPLFKLAKKFFYFLNIEQIKRWRISELQKMGPEGTDWVEFGQKNLLATMYSFYFRLLAKCPLFSSVLCPKSYHGRPL